MVVDNFFFFYKRVNDMTGLLMWKVLQHDNSRFFFSSLLHNMLEICIYSKTCENTICWDWGEFLFQIGFHFSVSSMQTEKFFHYPYQMFCFYKFTIFSYMHINIFVLNQKKLFIIYLFLQNHLNMASTFVPNVQP